MAISTQNKLSKADRVRRITDAVLSLPVLPTVTSKILQVVDHPKANAGMLADLVSRDQVLTAKVLKMANSSFYGFSREIGTVRQAVVLLGFNTLRDLSLSSSVFNLFRGQQNNPHFNVSEFWKHSTGVGLASRMLAERFHIGDASFAFTAGLLHDLGKVVFNQYMPMEYLQVMKKVFADGEELCMAEMDVLGASHDQVGAWLARRWKLPESLEVVMANHHHPEKAKDSAPICMLVQLADYITCLNKVGTNGRRDLPPLEAETMLWLESQLSLKEGEFENLARDLQIEYDTRAGDFFSAMGQS